jgi:hypothetical protein
VFNWRDCVTVAGLGSLRRWSEEVLQQRRKRKHRTRATSYVYRSCKIHISFSEIHAFPSPCSSWNRRKVNGEVLTGNEDSITILK